MIIRAGELARQQKFTTIANKLRGSVVDIRTTVSAGPDGTYTHISAPKVYLAGGMGVLNKTLHPRVLVEIEEEGE